jgi:hypothetical protein
MSGDEAYEEWLRDATDEEVDIEFGVQGMKYSDDGQVVSSGGWSVSQKEAIREQLEVAFEKWNKWKPFIPETVETIGEYEDGEPVIVCVGQGVSQESLKEKEVMINETLEAIEALTRKEEQ